MEEAREIIELGMSEQVICEYCTWKVWRDLAAYAAGHWGYGLAEMVDEVLEIWMKVRVLWERWSGFCIAVAVWRPTEWPTRRTRHRRHDGRN